MFTSPDVIQNILYQADPTEIIDLYNTNTNIRQKLDNPIVTKNVGQKFGWYVNDFDDFKNVYYTTILTDQCDKYLSPLYCLKWALRENNLKLIEKFIEFFRVYIVNDNKKIDSYDILYEIVVDLIKSGDISTIIHVGKILQTMKVDLYNDRDNKIFNYIAEVGNVEIFEWMRQRVKNFSIENPFSLFVLLLVQVISKWLN